MFFQVFTLLSFFLLDAAIGVPVRQKRTTQDAPWINPCVSNGASGGQALPPGLPSPPTQASPSVKELIETFRYRIDDAATKSNSLRQTMFTERIGSLQLESVYNGMHIDGMPLISDIEEWQNSNDTTKVVKADYKSLSKILVFMHQVKLDEIEHNNSTLKRYIEDTINDIYNSLCTLHNLLFCLNDSIDSHVTRDIMPQSQREIVLVSLRNQRDYVIAKDTMHFLFALKDSYISILSQM
ncbi:hypothetical protein LOTGIDRAFT_174018 [Lottia gigantea]|uniref:Ciliary neurotrophic factor n=1 Tax=Lottia gigantea TaxID=225164 RepID=V4A536_LOTGI|nr:hypothetical protein LOTGIDRAFT_174018 [Lottia gigantea]ESO99018.1 hypothetical protein LOTGIDRAFT_174018 [Lottia gigantea]